MSYEKVTPQRNNQIIASFRDNLGNTAIDDFAKLLLLNTSADNQDFLKSFRELRNKSSIIKQLTQPIGFFGRIGYLFKDDTYRENRYKAIVNQLKTGTINDRDTQQSQSYFPDNNNNNNKSSVYNKVQNIISEIGRASCRERV